MWSRLMYQLKRQWMRKNLMKEMIISSTHSHSWKRRKSLLIITRAHSHKMLKKLAGQKILKLTIKYYMMHSSLKYQGRECHQHRKRKSINHFKGSLPNKLNTKWLWFKHLNQDLTKAKLSKWPDQELVLLKDKRFLLKDLQQKN